MPTSAGVHSASVAIPTSVYGAIPTSALSVPVAAIAACTRNWLFTSAIVCPLFLVAGGRRPAVKSAAVHG
jgi:hypothetical protein